jgi:hypothetical protein
MAVSAGPRAIPINSAQADFSLSNLSWRVILGSNDVVQCCEGQV